jgi:hypothetical protein
MLQRLWFVLSGGWAILFLAAQAVFSDHVTERDQTIGLCIAFGPAVIGSVLARIGLWVLRG